MLTPRFCLKFAALLALSPLSAMAAPVENRPQQELKGQDTLAHPDPAVVRGVLANGLQYAIRRHPSHGREVIYLRIAAGSLDESDRDQGVAHFLEHMAFNGSRRFAPDTLIKAFEQAGIGFGRDQNANTSFDRTLYTLNIPDVTAAKLDLSFKWLADVADGLSLTPAEVERERGVVLSEYRLSEGPQADIARAHRQFRAPDVRATKRQPIGTEATIRAASADTIRAFYRSWYRPSNAFVVAVGDEPVEAIKARIEAAFGGWSNPTPEPPRADPGRVDLKRPFATISIVDPHASWNAMVCRYSPKKPTRPEDVESNRQWLAEAAWVNSFSLREGPKTQSDNPPFLGAQASVVEYHHLVDQACLSVTAKGEDWRGALAQGARDMRQLEQFGVTAAELDFQRSELLAGLDRAVVSAPTRQAGAIANNILENFEEQGTFDTPEEDRRVKRLAIARLDAKAVSAAFRTAWTEASPPLVVLIGPARASEAEIAEIWSKAQSDPSTAPVDAAKVVWGYGDSPKPGVVVARLPQKPLDFVRLKFANGVTLNFKQTDFAKGQVSVLIGFGAGTQEIAPGRLGQASFGSGYLLQGGFRKNAATDLIQICHNRTCEAQMQAARDHFLLQGTTRPEDLGLELQILTALLSEPGFRPSMDQAIPTSVHAYYRNMRTQPGLVANLALADELPRPHPIDFPAESEMAAYRSSDFAALLTPALTTAPLEVTIVGDVREADAVARVAATLGALPPREVRDRTRPDAVRTRYADTAPDLKVVTHDGPRDKAALVASWPLFVFTPERHHETLVLHVLAKMLQTQLIETIRQKLGAAYAPSASANFSRGGDQGALGLSIETSPEAVDKVREAALLIARGLAGGKIDQALLDQVRAPMLAAGAKERTYNSWWIGAMNLSERYPERPGVLDRSLDELAHIQLDEVKAAAQRWLSATPYMVEAIPSREPAKP